MLTPEERKLMRHALGLAQLGREYRNCYYVERSGWECQHWDGLIDKGLAGERQPYDKDCRDFYVTPAGRAALEAEKERET